MALYSVRRAHISQSVGKLGDHRGLLDLSSVGGLFNLHIYTRSIITKQFLLFVLERSVPDDFHHGNTNNSEI